MIELDRREKRARERFSRIEQAKQGALREGRIGVKTHGDDGWPGVVAELGISAWGPILIAAPNPVVSHWEKDLNTWGHFRIATFQGKRQDRERALESIEIGIAEILICPHSMIQSTNDSKMLRLAKTKWKLLVIDEFHKFKNRDSATTEHLRLLRDDHNSLVLGLTGKNGLDFLEHQSSSASLQRHGDAEQPRRIVESRRPRRKGILQELRRIQVGIRETNKAIDVSGKYSVRIRMTERVCLSQKDASQEVIEEGERKKAAKKRS